MEFLRKVVLALINQRYSNGVLCTAALAFLVRVPVEVPVFGLPLPQNYRNTSQSACIAFTVIPSFPYASV